MERRMAGYDIDTVRRNLPILNDWTYLNTGTVGIMAEPVLRIHLDNIADHERGGHATQERAIAGYERARASLAALLNVNACDIALNRNATDGINWVAANFPLGPGDEVITSTEEHPAMVYPWINACQRSGARLRFIPLSHNRDELGLSLAAVCTPATRVIALSHVSCETGMRVPVDVVREVAGNGVRVLVDASQSVGQFPVDIPNLRADFVIGNGHKWLAGPKGTGFAWFSQDVLDLVPPAYFGDGAVAPRWSRAYYQTDPPPALRLVGDASRFEFGTRAWHMYGALADAIEYQASLGWDSIYGHVARLSAMAKDVLGEIPGISVVTPPEWSDSSGIVTFTVADFAGRDFSKALWDDSRITQRSVEIPSGVRVSVTYFTTEGDITRLAEEVDGLSRGR
jgi:selenocysteine lyase/cysteine desulfurase